jgi:hypothetical protein
MARRESRPAASDQHELVTERRQCWACAGPLWVTYYCVRTVAMLSGLIQFRVQVRRCEQAKCPQFHRPYHAEAEGAIVLPHGEFGLEVVALAGRLRYQEHRSVPEIQRALSERAVRIAERTVTHVLQRYEELVALKWADPAQLRERLGEQAHVVLAIDGLQPTVGHEVLWVIRDCLSGEILLVRSLLGATEQELAPLLREAQQRVDRPVLGVVSDGQRSIRNAVATALPGVPHQLCQFHYLREAARPIYEADRHAKKELKKQVRGVRPIERQQEERQGPAGRPEAEAIRGYCLAVRSALTDEAPPPLGAPGLQLHDQLTEIAASIDRVAKKGGFPRRSLDYRDC